MKEFGRALKDSIHFYKYAIIALLDPRVSGYQGDGIFTKIGFENWIRVEAIGFIGGIWIFWRDYVLIDIVLTYPQFVLMDLEESSGRLWTRKAYVRMDLGFLLEIITLFYLLMRLVLLKIGLNIEVQGSNIGCLTKD